MCEWDETVKVRVKIPADLSCTGKEKWRECDIDSCIAPIVEALQGAGIDMRGSCCGHNKSEGDIHLQDGRVLVILSKEVATIYVKERRKDRSVEKELIKWAER